MFRLSLLAASVVFLPAVAAAQARIAAPHAGGFGGGFHHGGAVHPGAQVPLHYAGPRGLPPAGFGANFVPATGPGLAAGFGRTTFGGLGGYYGGYGGLGGLGGYYGGFGLSNFGYYGGFGYPGYFGPGYWGSGFGGGAYGYGMGYSVPIPVPVPVYSGPSAPVVVTGHRPAVLTLVFPVPTELWLNGEKVGTERKEEFTLSSPVLNPDAPYTFHVRGEWELNGKTYEYSRDITAWAGARNQIVVVSGSPVTGRGLPVSKQPAPRE